MYDSLLALSNSNEAPSEDVISTISNTIQGSTAKLLSIDADIKKVKRRLKALESEEQVIRNGLKLYHTILSPARRLPFDVLREIFCQCLPVDRYPTMNPEEAPLLLTRICRTWRGVALSTPQLWTSLHIPFYEVGIAGGSDRRWNAMKKRFEVVEEWLRKSGDLPLSLSLYYAYSPPETHIVNVPSNSQPQNLECSGFKALLSILIRFASRLWELDLALPQNVFKEFDSIADTANLTKLRTIRIRKMHSFNVLASSNLVKASNLHRITLTTSTNEWHPIPFMATPTLTELNLLETPLRPEYVITILESLPALKHCSLTISRSPMQQTQSPLFTTTPITLSCLETLHIQENSSVRTEPLKAFFASLDAPDLTWLSYHRHPYFYPTVTTIDNPRRVQFEPQDLIQRCSLKRLSFEQYILDSSAFEEVLRACSSTSHLDIGYPRREAGFADRGGLQDLDDLDMITPLIYSTERQDARWQGPWLPNLERLEAWCPNSITDESILRFILSRLSPENPISNLKSVKMYFLRSMQEDIAPRVLQHAEALGLDFELDLFYDPLLMAPERDPSTTSYGISDQESIRDSFYPYRVSSSAKIRA